MQNYEFRFYRADGEYSVCCYYACPSDRSALRSARYLLSPRLPTASVWMESRCVGQVYLAAPVLAA
jgi:hypothetical protein